MFGSDEIDLLKAKMRNVETSLYRAKSELDLWKREVEAVKSLMFRIAQESGVEVKFVEKHVEVTKAKKKG